ncbi:MAG: efflux RND transporter periplasmic adaptor subunit [Candidatus Kaelpia aquatica]|nr:efflux RND transporter periplasmic adaptor subunit [Candidatus Kaelpia aquatica]
MKKILDLSKVRQFFAPRKIVFIVVNVVIIAFLFLGVQRLFNSQDKDDKPLAQGEKERLIEGPKKKSSTEKKPQDISSLFPQQSQEEVPIKAYELKPVDFTDELFVAGTVRNLPILELKFETNGVLKSANFKEGEAIKRNDLLAALDPKDVNLEIQWTQAKLQASEAEYKAALKRYETVKRLYGLGAIIKDRLDQVQAETDVAKAKVAVSNKELELSKLKLEKLQLKAPQDGVIGKKEKEVGEFITSNDVICKFIDPDNTFVEAGIIERDIFKIKSGQKVKIKVDTYPTRVFFGYVEILFPEVDERTRTLNVRMRVLDPGKLLRPGMFARASVAVFRKKDAYVIPSSSVSIQQGAYYAAIVEEGKVAYRQISVEHITTDFAVIKKGLQESDLIVTETPGMKKLSAGSPVKIIEKQEKLF